MDHMLCWLVFLLFTAFVGDAASIAKTVTSSVQDFPHDSACFTQGLVVHEGMIYESCGLYGRSSLRKVDLQTGRVLQSQPISKEIFAEGITIVNQTIFMLSWKNKKVFLYDTHLTLLDTKQIATPSGEGWGVATDGKHLMVSDGSDAITFFPASVPGDGSQLVESHRIRVYDPVNLHHVHHINELEYVDGRLYANIWYKDVILAINPLTGSIVERYDLSNLYPKNRRAPTADCLNGIAFDPKAGHFLLTGKLWPKYYRVLLSPPSKDL